MICSKCGSQVKDGAKFCLKCGASLELNNVIGSAEKMSSQSINVTSSTNAPIKKKSKAPVIAISITVVILLIIAAVAFLLLSGKTSAKSYTDKIKVAEKYFDELEYEKAIAAYEEAIEIDPKREEAYLGLADTYMCMGEEDKAIEVLERAEKNIDDKNKLKLINAKKDSILDGKWENETGSSADDDEDDLAEGNKGSGKSKGNVSFTLTVYEANAVFSGEEKTLDSVEVSLVSGKKSYDGITGSDGKVSFDKIPAGEYYIYLTKDGYVKYVDSISVGNSDNIDKYLPLKSSNDDAIVMVEWDGNYDAEIAFFNASTNERISSGNPVDAEGSFIYGDNGASKSFEMGYLKNIHNSKVKSMYVVDRDAAVNGKASDLFKNNVRVHIYSGDKCIYMKAADSDASCNIWYIGYIYQGEMHDEDSAFSMNTDAGMEWASNTKEGYVEEAKKGNEGDVNWAQLYYDYINSNIDEHTSAFLYDDKYNESGKNIFFLLDITSDGVPELFINEPGDSASEDSNYYHICTIIDGKVVEHKLGEYVSGYIVGAGRPEALYTEGYMLFEYYSNGYGKILYRLTGSKIEKISEVFKCGEYSYNCTYYNYQNNKEYTEYHDDSDVTTYEGDYSGIDPEEMILKDISSTSKKLSDRYDFKDKSEMLKYLMSLGAASAGTETSSDNLYNQFLDNKVGATDGNKTVYLDDLIYEVDNMGYEENYSGSPRLKYCIFKPANMQKEVLAIEYGHDDEYGKGWDTRLFLIVEYNGKLILADRMNTGGVQCPDTFTTSGINEGVGENAGESWWEYCYTEDGKKVCLISGDMDDAAVEEICGSESVSSELWDELCCFTVVTINGKRYCYSYYENISSETKTYLSNKGITVCTKEDVDKEYKKYMKSLGFPDNVKKDPLKFITIY